MLWVKRFENSAIGPGPLSDISHIIAAIGRDGFGRITLAALDDALGIDHLSILRFGAQDFLDYREAVSVGDASASESAARQYFRRFNRLDPIRRVCRDGVPAGACLLVRCRPNDITDPTYRRECYLVPEIGERLALYGFVGHRRFQINLYRNASRTRFSDVAVDTFARLAPILLPSVARHTELLVGTETPNPAIRPTFAALKQRMQTLNQGLSERECEVCACLLRGQTIKGTALELHVRRTSVVTYRRRAYQKLGICCSNELYAVALGTSYRH